MARQSQISELKERLRIYEESMARQDKKIAEMIKAKDDDFTHSTIYAEMRRELLLADTLKQHEDRFRRQYKADFKLLDENKKLLEDNKALCMAHDAEYWIGLSDARIGDYYAIRHMESEILDLKAALAAKEEVIEHLKSILAGEDLGAPEKKAPSGRPRIDDATKKRIRKMYREGWTMKDISLAEGVSKGFVCQTCKGIQPVGKRKANKKA